MVERQVSYQPSMMHLDRKELHIEVDQLLQPEGIDLQLSNRDFDRNFPDAGAADEKTVSPVMK
ncbi:hypothetical protein D3C87_1856990 [compost metagenome]